MMTRLGLAHGFAAGDEISDRPQFLFQLPVDQFDGTGIQPRSGQLNEESLPRAASRRCIPPGPNRSSVVLPFLSTSTASARWRGNPNSRAKTLTVPKGRTPKWVESNPPGTSADAVDHFIGGAVAAGGDDGAESACARLGRPVRGPGRPGGALARRSWEKDFCTPAQRASAFSPSRRGIENNAGLHLWPLN